MTAQALLNSQISQAFSDGIQFVWSATTIKMAETCLRKYKYEMIEGWHGRTSSAHLIFGGVYAGAIEGYYKALAQGASKHEATRKSVRFALQSTWEYEYEERSEDEGVPGLASTKSGRRAIPDSGKPWTSDHNIKNRENLIRSIVWYLDNFSDDPAAPVTLQSGVPAVELNVTLPVDNGIVLSAHLDRLAEYADNLYVMDQKTTGTTISQRYFEQYSPDTQMSLYTFLGKASFGVPVRGVIIDAAQIAVGFTRFERGMTMRTEGQLNEWYDGAMDTILRAQTATRDNYFPMNPSACGNYGGCPFRGVCSRDPGVRKNFLAGDFTLGGGYDPLERR